MITAQYPFLFGIPFPKNCRDLMPCVPYYDTQKRQLMFLFIENYHLSGITIERGFVSNMASIPKTVRWIINQYGKHNPATAEHDKRYEQNIGNRRWADLRFLVRMKWHHVNYLKRWTMFHFVNWFGQSHWDKYAHQSPR